MASQNTETSLEIWVFLLFRCFVSQAEKLPLNPFVCFSWSKSRYLRNTSKWLAEPRVFASKKHVFREILFVMIVVV